MTDRIIPNALALPKIFHVARKSPAQESAGLKVVSRLIPRRADNRLVGTAPEPSFFGRQKSPARVAWPGPRDVSGICRANPDAPNLFAAGKKDDWNHGGRRLSRQCRRKSIDGGNHSHLTMNQIGHESRQSSVLAL